MPKFSTDQLKGVIPSINWLREAHARAMQTEASARALALALDTSGLPLELLQRLLANLRLHFEVSEEMVVFLDEVLTDDPASEAMRQIYRDTIARKEEILGFWEGKIRQRLH